MKIWSPRTGDRGVSDIVGVVILFSMAIVGALIVLGMGGLALDAISEQTQDDLAEDSLREVENRLSDLAERSVDSATTLRFPEGSGSDMTARPTNGSVTIEVVSTVNASAVEDDDGRCTVSTTLGTIQYENRDRTLLAYQGGGLWRQTSGVTQVESPPGFDYTGDSIDLSFVNLSTVEHIEEGNRMQASKNVSGSQAWTEELRSQFAPCWTPDEGQGTYPVKVSITIDSQFADGWARYAMADLRSPLDPADVTTSGTPLTSTSLDAIRENRQVTFDLGSVGDTSGTMSRPGDFPNHIIYSGLSQYAEYNTQIYPTGDAEHEVIVDRDEQSPGYTFGVFHPQKGWLVYDKNNNEEWVAKNEPGNPSVDEADLPVSTSDISSLPGGMSNATTDNTAFNLEENAAICVAKNSGQISNDNCNVSMVGIDDPTDVAAASAQYDVSISGTDAPVTEGDTLTVDVTVENTGSADGSKYVLLGDFDSRLVDYREVDLDQGETTTISLNWPTTTGDNGTDDVVVEAEGGDSYDTSTVTVNAVDTDRPEFQVSIDGTTSPVDEGQTVSVDATVENTGTASGTQWVVLEDFAGNPVDAREITLADGETKTVTLDWPTGSGDAGSSAVTVASENDDDTASVTVESGNASTTTFQVAIDGTNSSVDEGETLSVDATVENTGNETGTQWVVLEGFAGNPVDAKEVTLSDGATTTVSLTWKTTPGDAGTGDVTVGSRDHDDTTSVTVEDATGSGSGVVYVGPAGASGAEEYFQAEHSGTVYSNESDANNGGNCQGSETPYDDGCLSGSETASGYVLDEYGDEDYRLYAADTDAGTWVNVTRDGSGLHRFVHSDDVSGLAGSGDGQAYNHYTVGDDQPVCIAEDGASVDPDAACGPILENVTGDLDYNDSKNVLEVNTTRANLSLLTAQVGHAREEELDVRLPMDVFFVLDESGSMMATDYLGSGTADPDNTYTVPEGRVYEVNDDYYLPGEVLDVDEVTNVLVWGDLGNDPYGQRINATRSFISSLNGSLDRAGATQFDYDANRIHDLSGDLDSVNQSLYTDPGGSTDISAGIYDGIDGLTGSGDANKRVMVVLSDGVHNQGSPYPEEAAEDAADENITIYTVGLGDGVDKDQLQTVAQKTNGTYYAVDNASQLEAAFNQIVEETKQNRVIERDRTTVTAVTDSGMNKSVELADSSNLNDPNYFNDTSSETIATELESGLNNSELSFEMTVYSCENYSVQEGVTSTKDGETYVHTACTDYDTGSGTTIDNSDVTDHIIVTESNDNELSDIDRSEWWQPAPSSLSAMDPHTDGGEVNLSDNEAIIGLEVAAGNQTGYVLMHFAVNESSDVRDDWKGDLTEERADFTVDVTGTNSPVTEGETMTVTADIENVGDGKGTQYVVLRDTDGMVVNSTGVQLDPSETTTVTMSWPTEAGDAGSGNVTVATRDDTDSETVQIQPQSSDQGNLAASITGTNSPVTEGDPLTVDAVIENTGNATATQDVVLRRFDGAVVASQDVTVDDGDTESVTLTWQTLPGDAGTADVTVETRDDSDSREVTVNSTAEQGDFEVTDVETDSPVTEGETLTVDATIKNTGSADATRTLALEDFDGDTVDVAVDLQLDAGETTDVTFTWDTTLGDAGSGTVTVETGDDAAGESATVEERDVGGTFVTPGDTGVDPIDVDVTKIEIED